MAAALLLLWVLSRCNSGFDFTDEGFYLNWISSPKDYHASITQFGFVYHPLYKLLGGDIALLRQANVLIIFSLAFALSVALLRSMAGKRVDTRSTPPMRIATLALVIAACSLTFFDLWLPTPSYNSLTFTSLMLAAIGVLLVGEARSKGHLTGWILVGASGALSFLAKPTSAALLGVAVLLYLITSGKFWARGLLICLLGTGAFLIASALAIDGSLETFVGRLLDGVRLGSLLTPDQTFAHLLRLDLFNLSTTQVVNFTLLVVINFAVMLLGMLVGTPARIGVALMAFLLAALSISVSSGALLPDIAYEPFQPMLFWSVAIAVALSALVPLSGGRVLSYNGLALALFFIVLPYVYAFGTGNNYWDQAGRAGLFWLLGAFVVSAEIAARGAVHRILTALAASGLLVTGIVLFAAMENPYRQTQPLRNQNTVAEIGRENSKLFLTAEGAAYIQELRKAADKGGGRVGDPVLDFSGRSPGSVYAMGARAPGAAWLISGYPGSNEFLGAALDRVTCKTMASSWIIREPASPYGLRSYPLQRLGIDILTAYEEVGRIRPVPGRPGLKFEQRLLKPVHPDSARRACEQARMEAQ